MTTLVIDRTTPMEDVLSIMGALKLRLDVDAERRTGTIVPVIDPDDYDNDTDYLKAIPGMMESILESVNTPRSEFEEVPKDWIKRNV